MTPDQIRAKKLEILILWRQELKENVVVLLDGSVLWERCKKPEKILDELNEVDDEQEECLGEYLFW